MLRLKLSSGFKIFPTTCILSTALKELFIDSWNWIHKKLQLYSSTGLGVLIQSSSPFHAN